MSISTFQDTFAIEQIDVHDPLFNKILQLRRRAYDRDQAGQSDSLDDYSLHFAARNSTGVIGALRVTLRKNGPIESEQEYPQWLLSEFGECLCASSQMCFRSDFVACSSIRIALTRFAWTTVIPLGIRIDVSKARVEAIPYYMKLGYLFLHDSLFWFNGWEVRCGLIAFPATAARVNRISDLFDDLADPCDLSASPHAERFTASYQDFLNDVQHHTDLDEGEPCAHVSTIH